MQASKPWLYVNNCKQASLLLIAWGCWWLLLGAGAKEASRKEEVESFVESVAVDGEGWMAGRCAGQGFYTHRRCGTAGRGAGIPVRDE